MPRVHMYDSVRDHDERTTGILQGYFVGILLIVAGLFLLYYGVGFGIHLIWIGAVVFIAFKLTSKSYKKRYRYR